MTSGDPEDNDTGEEGEPVPVHQPGEMNVLIQWHAPDLMFTAVFVRGGEPWYLDGALVGMATTADQALTDLLDNADWLVREGESFLTNGPISEDDRAWLFELLDKGNDIKAIQARYVAMRVAYPQRL